MVKIATWNVNSLKVRLPHLLGWLATFEPDIVCLQELKGDNAQFPSDEIAAAGYRAVFAGQKTYNGVAILARSPLVIDGVTVGNPYFPDEAKRLIGADIYRDGSQEEQKMRVISAYFPNGQETGSEKYAYKLAWIEGLLTWLSELMATNPRLLLAGDFNIAPDERDVYDPAAWAGKILCSEPERAAFKRLLEAGFVDGLRLFAQPERTYSWWDYRQMAFQRNLGLRIDHILLTQPLALLCRAAGIDRSLRKLERPSDHAPVWIELDG